LPFAVRDMTCLNTLAILAPAKFENAGPRFDHDDFLEAGVCFILIPFVCDYSPCYLSELG
jgi:hypothetical protein